MENINASINSINSAIVDNEFVVATSLVNIEKQIATLDSSIREAHMLTYKFKRKYQGFQKVSDVFF